MTVAKKGVEKKKNKQKRQKTKYQQDLGPSDMLILGVTEKAGLGFSDKMMHGLIPCMCPRL